MDHEHLEPNPAPGPVIPPGGGAPRTGARTYLLFLLMLIWVGLVTGLLQGGAWIIHEISAETRGLPVSGAVWLGFAWTQALLLALPLALQGAVNRVPRFRAVYQTWAASTGVLFVLAGLQLFPLTWPGSVALAQVVLLCSMMAVTAMLAHRRGYRPALDWTGLRWVALLLPILAIPYLLFGAFGSALETVLTALSGLSFGLLMGLLLDWLLIRPLLAHSTGPGWDIALGGIAAGVALMIACGGLGMGGIRPYLMLTLALQGFALVAIARPAGRRTAWLPLAALAGGAAAAVLSTFDPQELASPLLDDTVLWAIKAATWSGGLALAGGAILWCFRYRLQPGPRLRPVGLALPGIAGLLVYALAGQPGFYPDRFFVILRDSAEAEIRSASSIPDRTQRLAFVYQSLTRKAESSQAGLRAELDRLHVAYTPYYLVNGLEMEGGPLLRARLARRPEVERIIESPRLRPSPAPPARHRSEQPAPDRPVWNVTMVGADKVWKEFGVTGTGIVVGETDTGADWTHPALRDGYRGKDGEHDYNWLDSWNQSRVPSDPSGHGTHTLGSIVGRGGIGLAPGAQWFGCANLVRNLGNTPHYLDCLQFTLAPYPLGGDPFRDGDPSRAAHVVNASWGCPPMEGCDSEALRPAMRAFRAAGIFVAVAAGNDGPECGSLSYPPAAYQESFTVGAVDQKGGLTRFSSRGPAGGLTKPDVVAPGRDILSALPGGGYAALQGTSMAAPHVAGVVALMWSAQPRLIGDIDRTEAILRQTARRPPSETPLPQGDGLPFMGFSPPAVCTAQQWPNNAYGHGIVDAYSAVKTAMAQP